jgi:hypothetical protein
MEGTVIRFNPTKRHGLIQTDEAEPLRVDAAGFAPGTLLGDRCRGTRVRFHRMPGEQDAARAVDASLWCAWAAVHRRGRVGPAVAAEPRRW